MVKQFWMWDYYLFRHLSPPTGATFTYTPIFYECGMLFLLIFACVMMHYHCNQYSSTRSTYLNYYDTQYTHPLQSDGSPTVHGAWKAGAGIVWIRGHRSCATLPRYTYAPSPQGPLVVDDAHNHNRLKFFVHAAGGMWVMLAVAPDIRGDKYRCFAAAAHMLA